MNSGHLQSGSGRLQEAWDVLQTRWMDVREQWQDARAERFEEEQLRPLAEAMQLALPAISQMASATRAMQHELDDERHQGSRDW